MHAASMKGAPENSEELKYDTILSHEEKKKGNLMLCKDMAKQVRPV